ncbi:UNVERIFIED_CONTAM: hypothetical protein PYX00_006922 [Menopon gallinae]|uniref:Uncharacterized protein n=1 Tax=Menopon gallinae TaxID=328185 RepID=A0AAW2HGX9_9NEOP
MQGVFPPPGKERPKGRRQVKDCADPESAEINCRFGRLTFHGPVLSFDFGMRWVNVVREVGERESNRTTESTETGIGGILVFESVHQWHLDRAGRLTG